MKKKKSIKWNYIVPIICSCIAAAATYFGAMQVETRPFFDKFDEYEAIIKDKEETIKLLEAQLADKKITTGSEIKGDVDANQTGKLVDSNGDSLVETYDAFDFDKYNYFEKISDKFNMNGKEYSNGFVMKIDMDEESVTFNINKKYKIMKFDMGHIDNSKGEKMNLQILADGEKKESITFEATNPVKNYQINLDNCEIVKFIWSCESNYGNYGSEYGLAKINLL